MIKGKVVVILICLFIIFSSIVIVINITPTVKAPTTWYVDDVPGGSPTENFTSIQDAINASSNGDTVFVYNGTYYENVVVNKSINLIGEDKNNTIIDGSGIGDIVHVKSNWVNVSGFKMTNSGDNGFPTYDSGIELNNVSYCTLIYNNASDNSYGIYLENSDMNSIIGNKVTSNGFGIFLEHSNKNNISGNNISSNSIDGVQSRYSNWNSLINNDISDCINGIHLSWSLGCNLESNKMRNDGIIIQGAMIEYWISHNINISNTVNDRGVYFLKNQTGGAISTGFGQIILANCSNIKISDHNLSNTSIGLLQGFSSGSNITGNNFINNFFGLRLVWSYDNIITENDFETNHVGIQISLSNKNKITNNNLYSNFQDGIEIWGSKYNELEGNIVTLSSSGIKITYAEENNCTGNEISENIYGVRLFDSLQNNITYNNLSLNTDSGFYLKFSENNNLSNNNVMNNLNGFYILSSSINNTSFHNNVFGNEIQAIDETNSSNLWDNGYPSGGNYWSDYTGIDEFRGPSQDIPGSDGIGDTNYSIDSDSVDNYPLMNPIGNLTLLYEGWNLISVPFIQPDINLDSVLSSINGSYDAVQWYNTSDFSNPWKHHQISKPSLLNDLTDIAHKMGFWIHITKPGGVLFEYYGTQPTSNQSILLHPGWNMVGYPSLINRNRTAALNNLTFGVEVDAIWTFDAATQTWEEIGGGDYFEVGRGYWIHARQGCVWEVPV